MNPLQHKTKAKLVAAILVFYLLAFFTLSLAYEVKEAHHPCQGDQCPICHQIQNLERIKEQFSFSLGNVSIFFWTFLSILTVALQKTTDNFTKTLVQLHVRLNH